MEALARLLQDIALGACRRESQGCRLSGCRQQGRWQQIRWQQGWQEHGQEED
jgi:hypothetical protein